MEASLAGASHEGAREYLGGTGPQIADRWPDAGAKIP